MELSLKWPSSSQCLKLFEDIIYVHTLGVAVPMGITGLWAMRGSKRCYTGGCQVRPLTPSECHNRYIHEVVSKIQSQRRRLREMTSLGKSTLALRSLRQRRKKLGRQRRLELGPSSNSSHGQGLSNAFLTSAIGMLGQKFLYMIRCHYEGGWQVRPLSPR